MDDSSNDADYKDENEEGDNGENDENDDDQNTEYDEPIRKSNSINESERYGSSEDENANDSCSIEMGENSRKRKNYDSDNIPTAFKKQDLESSENKELSGGEDDSASAASASEEKKNNKRNLEDCSNQEDESHFKKTKYERISLFLNSQKFKFKNNQQMKFQS